MRHIPNLITVFRVLLIPVLAWLLVERNYAGALTVFAIAAVSDFFDGVIARRFGFMTEFGARLDPIADKLTMLVTTVMLAAQGWVPVWLAAAIVLRDVTIVSGAVAYHMMVGRIAISPTWLSKINTALEFAALTLVLADAASAADFRDWLPALFALVFVTVVASGAQYVWVWSRKAKEDAKPKP
ncbi:MAG: CDP-alcohol phosphatidyltransferase family protein [Burkholderiales bacterium]|nr:CDP-alcohol phosphatidyltransferase family protein [Burkholderiales bacterium]